MSDEHPGRRATADELLEMYDGLDALDEELRVQKIALRLTPLVSVVLAVPLLAVLFFQGAPHFAVYPTAFVVILGGILYALTVDRRRLEQERAARRERIEEVEAELPLRIGGTRGSGLAGAATAEGAGEP